jgi:hypothetical protein
MSDDEELGDKPPIVFVFWCYGQVPKALKDWPGHEVVEQKE